MVSRRARYPAMHACGPVAKVTWLRALVRQVEAVGVGENRWVPVCGSERDDDQVTFAYLRTPDLDVSRSVTVNASCRWFQSLRLINGGRQQQRIRSNRIK